MTNLTIPRNGDLRHLVTALQEQHAAKLDLVVPASQFSMQDGKVLVNYVPASLETVLEGTGVTFGSDESGRNLNLDVLQMMHSDISEKLGIPVKFYERLRAEQLDMLDYNVTQLMHRSNKNYLVRTFSNADGSEGIGRALLSDRYRIIDHMDVLTTALDAIRATGVNLKVESCDLTEKRMHVRFYCPDIQLEANDLLDRYSSPRKGGLDGGIYAGFTLTNSETGDGRFSIAPRLVVGACRNGMVFKSEALGWFHLGGQMAEGVIEWSDTTKAKESELIRSQVTDAVTQFTSQTYLQEKVDLLSASNERLVKPVEAVKLMGKSLMLSEDAQQEVLNYFMVGSDPSTFGMVQAVTAFAYDLIDADRAYELEAAVPVVIEACQRANAAAVLN